MEIWRYALSPLYAIRPGSGFIVQRVVLPITDPKNRAVLLDVTNLADYEFCSLMPNPATLSVNRESRFESLPHYKIIFGKLRFDESKNQVPIYFHTRLDSLAFNPGYEEGIGAGTSLTS